MGVKAQDIAYQIDLQDDRVTAAASPAILDIVPEADAIALGPGIEIIQLNTDHGLPGEMYSDLASRNSGEFPVKVLALPTIMGRMLDAVFKRNSSTDELYYHQISRWWKDKLGSSTDKGERFWGMLFNKIELSFMRAAKNEPIQLGLSAFLNAKRRILNAETSPTYDQCKCPPLGTSGLLFDFVHDSSLDSYGADDTDVRAVSISFDNGISLDAFADNVADAPLHRSWTVHAPGNPSATVKVTLRLNDRKYLILDEFTNLPAGKLRVAGVHPKATSITSTSTVTAGSTSTQTLLVSSTTGFLVNDIVLITHPTSGFCTAKITTVNAGVSLVISGYDPRVSMNGASGGPLTIRNMAFGLVFDRMDFTGRSSTKRDGSFQNIELEYAVKLKAGSTFPLEYHAYNHANSRIS